MPTVRTGDLNVAATARYTQFLAAIGTRKVFIRLAVSNAAAVFSEDLLQGRSDLQELLIFALSGRDVAGQYTEDQGNHRDKGKDIDHGMMEEDLQNTEDDIEDHEGEIQRVDTAVPAAHEALQRHIYTL